YVTLFLLLLGLLFIAVATDVGWMAYVRTQGQAATDAAALRAAAAIVNYNSTGSTTQVYNMAAGLNSNNTVMNQAAGVVGADIEFCTGDPNGVPTCSPGTFPIPARGVRVTRTYSTPLFFSQLLNGGSNANITVSSTAWLGGPGGLRPELPVALCKDEIQFNPDTLTCVPSLPAEFSPNNKDNAGWWNKADSGQPSASECKNMVKDPETIPYLNINDIIDLNNGEVTSCHKEIEDKFKNCTAASCSGAEGQAKKDFCTVILPIVDCQNSINTNEPVLGFAAMCITKVKSTPASQAVIEGTLNCNVQAQGAIGAGPQFGIYADRPVLVK
ncbi:MAG: pilus assembly protein TadG-related protein, partial [Candidatus Binatia bacterium]